MGRAKGGKGTYSDRVDVVGPWEERREERESETRVSSVSTRATRIESISISLRGGARRLTHPGVLLPQVLCIVEKVGLHGSLPYDLAQEAREDHADAEQDH